MTKDEYISEMIEHVKRVDSTRQVHPKVVEAAIDSAVSSVVSKLYLEGLFDLSTYTYTYENVAIYEDKVCLTKDFAEGSDDLGIIHIPRIGGGVMSIRPSEEMDVMFFPMRVRDAGEYQRMHSTKFNTDVGFVVRGNDIQFIGDLGDLSTVDVDVVRSFEDYDYEETFYFPLEYGDEVKNIVLQKLGISQPVSLKNDNSDEFNRG